MKNIEIIILTAGALAAVFFDLENRKIPNKLIISMWFLGITLSVCGSGVNEIQTALRYRLWGIAMPLLILIPLFRFKLMGAGDIKLLSALGGIAGLRGIWHIGLGALICGGFLAVGIMAADDISFSDFRFSVGNMKESYRKAKALSGCREEHYDDGKRMRNVLKRKNHLIHFSVPIFMGVILYVGGLI